MTALTHNDIRDIIQIIPDFPKEGIIFRDITPLLQDKKKFRYCIDHFVSQVKGPIDYVVSIESRGFIFGSALAYALGAGFVPIRKQGKLPREKYSESYDLEYGQAVIEMHQDALKKGSRIIIVDDVLATGGTVEAAVNLVKKFDTEICGMYFLIELMALKGRDRVKEYALHSLVSY